MVPETSASGPRSDSWVGCGPECHRDAESGYNSVIRFIENLVGAWDCCGTCAGSVIAQRDREQRAETMHTLDTLLASDDLREAIAERISWDGGDFTRYGEGAVDDHNRWSWRGDGRREGHGEAMREGYRQQADAALAVVRARVMEGMK